MSTSATRRSARLPSIYVNVLSDDDQAGVRRAYGDAKLRRLSDLKRRWGPDNVFHLNQNIAPAL